MYCNQCGKEIAEQSKFCNFCGSKIMTLANSSVNVPSGVLDMPNNSQTEKLIHNLGSLIKPIKNMEAHYAQFSAFEKRVKSWENNNTLLETLGVSLLIGVCSAFVISLLSNIFLDTEGIFNTLYKICFVLIFAVFCLFYGKRTKDNKKNMIEKNKVEADRYHESGQNRKQYLYFRIRL